MRGSPGKIAMRWRWLALALLLTAANPAAVEARKSPPAVAAVDKPVREGQALIKEHKFPEALAKFGEAQGAAAAIGASTARLFYQVAARLGASTALDGMQRYDSALQEADWANHAIGSPRARTLPATLKAAVHRMRGVILYHLKRKDDAKAMFALAVKEGDKSAADWQRAIDAPPVSTKPADLVLIADKGVQGGNLLAALVLYSAALRHYEALGDKTPEVMQRALNVALRIKPPPPIPDGASDRLKKADAALSDGALADLDAARDLLRKSVIEVPWWSDGWKRLADVQEKRGDFKAARGALRYYLKAAPQAGDESAVEQRIASLDRRIDAGGSAATPTPANFDGAWSITQVCPAIGNTLGYAFNFATQVSGGRFHAEEGVKGQPGSWSLEGKIAADGAVAIRFDGLISTDKSHTAGNAQAGKPYGYDVEGRVTGTSGTGKRMSARHCDWTFVKQATGQMTDISGPWTTGDGRVIAIKQNGNQVSWSSCCQPGRDDLVVTVSGTFDGTTLNGTYSYRDGQNEGSGVATLTLSGDRMEGHWQAPDGKTFPAVLIRHRGEALGALAGKWTTHSGRTVTLNQTGNQVTWTACCRQSNPNWTADIAATFDGKYLVGTFHWQDGDKQGNGTASYTLNGNQLDGELNMPGQSEPVRSVLTRQTESSLAGKWTMSTGSTLTLTQSGNQVTGLGCCRPGHPDWRNDVSGTFDGKNYVGIFHVKEGDEQRTGTFIYVLTNGRLEGGVKQIGGRENRSVLIRAVATSADGLAPAPPALPPQATAPIDTSAKPGLPRAAPTCRTEPVNFMFRDNPSVSSKQKTSAGGVCSLNYKTGSPGMATIIAKPSHGALTQQAPLKLSYRPAEGYAGADKYVVKLCDQAGCATITYNVTVE